LDGVAANWQRVELETAIGFSWRAALETRFLISTTIEAPAGESI
jgi:hypothetical protein